MDTVMTTARIYAHKKRREEWGYAILAYERDDKRSYLFQDGKLRAFTKDYCHLLVPAAPDDSMHIARNLKAMLRSTLAAKESTGSSAKEPPKLDLAKLHEIFVTVFPGGLRGEEYASNVRGAAAERRLKRHRDAAVAEAVEAFPKKMLTAAIKNGSHDEVRDLLVSVLSSTDLVTKKQIAPLEKLAAEDLPSLTTSLEQVLYGTGPFEARFERLVHVLERSGETVTWELATAPAALVLSDRHVYVKGTAMKQFAQRLVPTMGWTTTPSGFVYGRLLGMAEELAFWLSENEDAARDFFDVSMLIDTVMKPGNRAELDKKPKD
jgi:hypothetical protein